MKKSSALLGLVKKEGLEVSLAPVDETVFSTGIQKVSSEQQGNDETFILYQLTSLVPPHLWEEHFGLDAPSILQLFAKDQQYKSLLNAFAAAAIRFRNVTWVKALIALPLQSFHPSFLSLLSQKEAEQYAGSFMQQDETAYQVVQHFPRLFDNEWGLDFTKTFLGFTSRNPYQYHKGFYSQWIHLFPASIATELEGFAPKEEYLKSMWTNVTAQLQKLLQLKTETFKAFNQ